MSRIVLVRLRNWVGEVVLSVPALQLLQDHGCTLRLVGKPWAKSLLAGYDWPIETRAAGLRPRVAQWRRLRAQARQDDPAFDEHDNALVMPNAFSGALEMRLAGLRAVGYGQEARGWLLSRCEPITYGGHAFVSYWELACRFLGIDRPPPASLGLRIAPAARERAAALLHQHGLPAHPVLLCPFAGSGFEKQPKTWPEFRAFTQALLQAGHPVLACPGPGEAAQLAEGYEGLTVLEGVDLATYAALAAQAALVVSNDTGPGHLAAAVGAPLISVLGPTKPEQWGPWGPNVQVLRRWPDWPSVAEVVAAAETRLSAQAGPAPGARRSTAPEPNA